ncbi:MAG: sigma-54-dependent Fis family transcriptional regulator [Marinilabiliales bacterium]|nr:MAG: sigma-54-dependent Fis family transcriptional regulator [Marinilabiliales bacterium]
MPKNNYILVIDDDTYICNILKKYLEQNDFKVDITYKGAAAKELIAQNHYDIILCDYRLPDYDGMHILRYTRSVKPLIPVVIMTAYAEISKAVELIKSGAFDYIVKPMQPEMVIEVLNRALDRNSQVKSVASFSESFIQGNSEKMLEVMQHVEIVASTDITVMIEGETGSGKEFIARAIHHSSNRSKAPFIPVDCGAIPGELANSVLFGHVKGSFTGAVNDKTGYFQEAKGGTLFLDEVGNLSYENQVKILRALQEKTVTRIGDNKAQRVDIRLIAASNENLHEKVEAGEFREDLYHRLNEFMIKVPALRSRREDIIEFAGQFINQANKAFNKSVQGLDDEARELLLKYEWPGNIRELQNVIKRAVLLSPEDVINPGLFPDELRLPLSGLSSGLSEKPSGAEFTDLKSATYVNERELIQNALEKTNNNKSRAARLLGIDRKTLYNKIRLYNLKQKD